MTSDSIEPVQIDLSGIEVEDIELFLQEGSRGMPEFAASCSTICHYLCCVPSCNVGEFSS